MTNEQIKSAVVDYAIFNEIATDAVEVTRHFDGDTDRVTGVILSAPGCNDERVMPKDGYYALPADDGIEVRRNADDEVIGYLPTRATDGVDTDDPAAVMASRHFRVVDEDGDVI